MIGTLSFSLDLTFQTQAPRRQVSLCFTEYATAWLLCPIQLQQSKRENAILGPDEGEVHSRSVDLGIHHRSIDLRRKDSNIGE